MIRLKNEIDIKYIRKAIKIGEHILQRIARWIEPGITPKRLNKYIEHLIWRYNSKSSFKGFQGFPSASCISVNEDIIHGVPNDVPLNNGDIVKIDVGINYKNYYSDQARTYIVGGGIPSSPDTFRLLFATELALGYAKKTAIAGNTIGDISSVIEKIAKRYGLGILKDYCGHGVGFEVHEEPRVPNVVGLDKDVKLVKGLVLALEPMFVLGKGNYRMYEDGTIEADGLSAHFEKTIII